MRDRHYSPTCADLDDGPCEDARCQCLCHWSVLSFDPL